MITDNYISHKLSTFTECKHCFVKYAVCGIDYKCIVWYWS